MDKKEIASRSIRYIDGSYFIVMYYAVWMEICRGTLNREMAQQIIVEGKPFLDRKYGMDAISMAADTVVYNYYILFGNFEMARRYVDKVMSYRSAQADKFVSKYYMAAEINMIFGNVDAARAILEQGKRKMGNKTAVINQVFEVFRVRLGL